MQEKEQQKHIRKKEPRQEIIIEEVATEEEFAKEENS